MKLSFSEKVGYGAGDTAIGLVMGSMAMIVTYFYTDVYGLRASDVGILLIVVRFVDAISDPLVGIITDRTKTRWGRYRPYLLFFSVPFGLSIWMMFSTPDYTYAGKLAWAFFTYILLTLAYTLISIPYISLIGVITDDPQERLVANSYRFVMNKTAVLVVTSAVPILALYLGEGNLASGYKLTMGVMAVAATLLCLFCFAAVKERITHPVKPFVFKQQVSHLFKNDQWMILGAAIAIIMFGGIIRSSVSAYYAKYYLNGGEDLIAPFLTLGVVASGIAIFLATYITNRYDKIKMFRITQFLTFAFGIAMYFVVGQDDIWLAFIFYFLLSLLGDMQLPVYWAAIAEAVDYGELKSGVRVSGLAFGGILFFQKFGMGLAGGFVGLMLSCFDYQPGQAQSAQSLTGIALLMTIIPAVFNLLVTLLMRKYIINNDYYYQQIKVRLAEKLD